MSSCVSQSHVTCHSSNINIEKIDHSCLWYTNHSPSQVALSIMISLLVSPLQFLADHPKWMLAPVVVYGVASFLMSRFMGDRIMPDLMFGFSPSQIHALHEEWYASDGCSAYIKASMVDLFPYMESYSLVVGTLLVMVCRRHSFDERWANLIWVVMGFDVGETVILQQACRDVVSDDWLRFASICNQAKWTAFVTACISVVVALRLPRRRPQARKASF